MTVEELRAQVETAEREINTVLQRLCDRTKLADIHVNIQRLHHRSLNERPHIAAVKIHLEAGI